MTDAITLPGPLGDYVRSVSVVESDVLRGPLADGSAGTFDLVFIAAGVASGHVKPVLRGGVRL